MLTNRWSVLALLFVIRIGFGIQFQAVSALSPLFLTYFHVNAADLGMMIGLYVIPGIILAYPGSAIGQRFGEKRVVLFCLALMVAGGLIMATTSTWPMLIAAVLSPAWVAS
jgi:predicted MFS family arabinose efflux permease